ncbi:MAG: agmatinase [Syntrophales bacterium]
MTPTFLEIEPQYYDYRRSKFVVIPCPHEATTSYGRGTKHGPAAILQASQQVETFDESLGYETYQQSPIYTERAVGLSRLTAAVKKVVDDDKIPVILGGEHSLTPFAVKACADKYHDLSVLQLDAHADLRDSYRGSKHSHACAARRLLEIAPLVQAGVRSLSREEWDFAKSTGQLGKIHWAGKIKPEKIVEQLSDNVYLTIDVDVFDPAVVRSTGTPEPGGLLWTETLNLLTKICEKVKVVGFDVVELSPQKGDLASDFTAAKLIYKLMGLAA